MRPQPRAGRERYSLGRFSGGRKRDAAHFARWDGGGTRPVRKLCRRKNTPPHFHVRYGKQKAVIGIEPVELLHGKLSPKAKSLVLEWAALH